MMGLTETWLTETTQSQLTYKLPKAEVIQLTKLTSSTNEFPLPHINRKYCLGEGPIWDHRSNRLIWIDIVKGKLYSMNPDTCEATRVDVAQPLGTVVPVEGEKDKVIVALLKGFAIVDLFTGEFSTNLGNPEGNHLNLRWNDGKCDPQGRLWVGSMHMFGYRHSSDKKSEAGLWMIESDGSATRKLDAKIGNGIVWSSDNQTMYWIDSPTQVVKAYDFDEKSGEISNPREVVKCTANGFPDGMAIDTEDKLWVCRWDGWGIGRYDPETGEELMTLELPCARVTACAFGGEKMDQLYVTTAYCGISPADKEKQPLAGRLFKFDLSSMNITGAKSHFFKLGTSKWISSL